MAKREATKMRLHHIYYYYSSCNALQLPSKYKSEPSPTSADACGEVTGCTASCQEVSTCSTRGGSQGIYITFASTKQVNKTEPTLALKHRVDFQNRGTSGLKIGHVPVKNFKKRRKKVQFLNFFISGRRVHDHSIYSISWYLGWSLGVPGSIPRPLQTHSWHHVHSTSRLWWTQTLVCWHGQNTG